MEKQKKKLSITGKPKKTFVPQQNFVDKKKTSFNDKKFSKPLSKITSNFKKTFIIVDIIKYTDRNKKMIKIIKR